MAKITTLSDMRFYIKTMLGYPAINIELPDSVMNQVIEDACQTFARYNEGEGSYKDYVKFTTSAGVREYPVSGIWNPITSAYIDNVQNVYDFGVAIGLDGINIMFTPSHILLHDQYVTQGAYPGGTQGAQGVNDGLTLANYTIAQMYIKSIGEYFGKTYRVTYNFGRETICLDPTPGGSYTGVLILNRKSADEQLYNHPLVKRLATGKSMMIWGQICDKYGGTMPDGLVLNASAIFERGQKMYDEAEEDCYKESSPLGFIVG